jgi:hypothetical protein
MKHTRRLLGAVVVVLAVVGALTEPAAAHYVYAKHTTYASDTNCTGSRAEISHGDGGGYSKADTYSWYRWTSLIGGDMDCQTNWKRPPGHLIAALQHYKFSVYRHRWEVCRYTNWYRNGSEAWQFMLWTRHGTQPDCGAGYYATMSWGAVWNNSTWFPSDGRGVWSGDSGCGCHYLPA